MPLHRREPGLETQPYYALPHAPQLSYEFRDSYPLTQEARPPILRLTAPLVLGSPGIPSGSSSRSKTRTCTSCRSFGSTWNAEPSQGILSSDTPPVSVCCTRNSAAGMLLVIRALIRCMRSMSWVPGRVRYAIVFRKVSSSELILSKGIDNVWALEPKNASRRSISSRLMKRKCIDPLIRYSPTRQVA